MNLSFLMIAESGGDDLWARCGALAAVTEPGDEVLLCDSGASVDGAQLLRRFGEEVGWGEKVTVRLVALSDTRRPPEAGWSALRGLSDRAVVLVLPDRARPVAKGIKALRAMLEQGAPDLVLVNSAWMLAGPHSVLSCPDVGRWPMFGAQQGDAARAAALQLMPDPARLLPTDGQPGDDYEAAIEQAASIGFVPDPVLLSPLPAPRDPAPQVAALSVHLSAAPRDTAPDRLARALLRLDDILAQLDPGHAESFLHAARDFTAALPRRLRRQAVAHEGQTGAILSDLKRGDTASARSRLAVIFTAQDRARVAALTGEIGQLRSDLDLALPGPDYLMDLFHRTRRA
ncbi:hypothetical protein [Thalassovita aquimarina]|uniref:hypothetical protein n=1 Tax=Thalassovita aquimarina TaxID=2785917 RepID=UPI003568AA7D